MIQNYVRVNNKLINTSWAIPKGKEPKEMIELLNNGIAMQVVLSVKGDNDKKQNENILTEAKKFVYNQNIWRMSLEQLEEVKGLLYATKYEMQTKIDIAEYPYINPEFIEEMNNTTEKIKEIKYWSDSAKEFLALLILSNLVSGQQVSLDSLKEQTKEIEFLILEKKIKDINKRIDKLYEDKYNGLFEDEDFSRLYNSIF